MTNFMICTKIPSNSFDLTAGLGYGLIFKPIIAHINPLVNPMLMRSRNGRYKKRYIRRDKK